MLSRRTYLADRRIRYYVAPVRVRESLYYYRDIPRHLRSHRMRRLVDYIQTRLGYSRRALGFLRSSRSEISPTATLPRMEVSATSPTETINTQQLSHLDQAGAAHMVNISNKAETTRSATAVATLLFSNPETYTALSSYQVIKGDAIAVARVAAFQAAKKTADLVPLAHPSLQITGMSVDIDTFSGAQKSFEYTTTEFESEPITLSANKGGVTVTARVECYGKTGVEMEAVTAATVGAVTMFDMLKAVDKGLVIMGARVIEKRGGKSGDWTWDARNDGLIRPVLNDGPKPAVAETSKSSASSSDIDEWNQGLAAEFSIPGGKQGETLGKTPFKETDDQSSITQSSNAIYSFGKRTESSLKHTTLDEICQSQTRSHSSNPLDQVTISPTIRADTGPIHASTGPNTFISQNIGNIKPKTCPQGPLYTNRLSLRAHSQHERAAQSLQHRLRKSIDSAKGFVEVVGRRLEATMSEEGRAQQAVKDMQQGKLEKTNKEWHVETMTPVDRDLWPGHGSHNVRKIDSKSFQARRFRREWEQSIYGKGSQVK